MLTYGLITAPQITETGPVVESVPFHRTSYSAEGIVTANLTFKPVISQGTEESLKPIPGNTATYTLVGNGVAGISFDSLFIKHPDSMDFNNTNGVVNRIEFLFDGVSFWYTLTTSTAAQWLELVGDFGYGPDLIVITGAECTIKDFMYNGLPSVQVTAFDLLTSVHYLGSDPLTYEISIDDATWFSNTDPRKAVLELDATYAGAQDIYVRVTDGDLTSLSLIVPITVIISYP